MSELVCITALLFGMTFWILGIQAHADDMVTAFGSEHYSKELGSESFPIGIYIISEENMGHYHMELRYDNTRLKYLEGGTLEDNGTIIVEGDAEGNEVRVFLYFETISGGSAGIKFVAASASIANQEGMIEITDLAYAPIDIMGNDLAGISFEELLEQEAKSNISLEEQKSEEDSDEDNGDNIVNQENIDNLAEEINKTTEAELSEEHLSDLEAQKVTAADIYEKSKNQASESKTEYYIILLIVLTVVFVVGLLCLLLVKKAFDRKYSSKVLDWDEDQQYDFEFDKISSPGKPDGEDDTNKPNDDFDLIDDL